MQSKGKTKRQIKHKSQRHGWNVSEWCDLYGFSRTFYYKLAKQGKAPVTISVGGVRLVTIEADTAWRMQCGTETV